MSRIEIDIEGQLDAKSCLYQARCVSTITGVKWILTDQLAYSITNLKMEKAKAIARYLCEQRGYNPDGLEPGDGLGIDGYMKNGDPAHFIWREWVSQAEGILKL